MRLGDKRESSNVEDRRGQSRIPGGKAGIGIGTVVLALVAMYFGVDPRVVLQNAGTPSTATSSSGQASGPVQESANEAEARHLVSVVLADTEDTWNGIFQAGGQSYREPTLVLFRGATETACGVGQSAMGPFYCPADEKVYIDLAFYDDLKNRFQAPGDFAEAYVIAHEIGHHVQKLLGISDQVREAQQRSSKAGANALSVRLELQADCLAGIWANQANRSRSLLEAGDLEEALNAATAIGDDRLQQQGQGYVVPESFTHGSSQQRVRWFKRGMDSGDMNSCDTFKAQSL